MARLPLGNVRVADLTMWWSGPGATRLLADMGAEVIKIESHRRFDGWRGTQGQVIPPPRTYNKSASFNSENRNKYGITLDLTTDEGVEIFKMLVRISDIVVENYSPRVMQNLGLDYPVLKDINPSLIVLSMPAYGRTGPEKDYVAFGYSIESMVGLNELTGYAGESPMRIGIPYGDPMAARVAAFAAVSALYYRRKTGKGQFIDLSQLEATVPVVGEAILGFLMNGRVPPRMGNRNALCAPHGCYRCRGEDRWVTIAVKTDKEWKRLVVALGNPGWSRHEKFATQQGRWQNQEELDRHIEEWTSQRDPYEVMHLLQAAGVAAGAVLNAKDILLDPHLKERAFFERVIHQEMGEHPYAGMVCKLSKTPGKVRFAAPCLGEHNSIVLGGLIGMSAERMAEMEKARVIGTEPV